ncbi:rab effector MyRIP isoform X1 [Monodelphis domestica]|uniref:rab effector MyRIP isoform X1 n=1 Tax=Monodelphis domestica TaxID=13616 RepID=UPI0024E1EAD9|nr:rab effector MyRIP isoform X1 [Monodelphis domestica]XP_056656191.1 rab effector MyRIP isoform X1 [Monodelphis domestica]
MGRKLDLSSLTDDETEHVLQVVQRDFNLRKKEEERLSEMKQKLDEEGSKCSILSKHREFTEHCCMRCCAPFTFLLNTKRQCCDCKYNICKSCSSYQKKERMWLCCVCQQTRLLRAQSLEWYYNNVKSRFKRFGSAKVLKNLYKKHRLESGACFDIIEASFLEPSLENEGSISGSDSTFYRQTEGHSMMDTLAVALRVAEEAVEEAISKAEASGDSLDKQNEACYLREHKEELIEELATTIVQKIIRKQKSKEQTEKESDWTQPSSNARKVTGQRMPAFPGEQQASCSLLQRSQSAFSLTGQEAPSKESKVSAPLETLWAEQRVQEQKPKEQEHAALPSWKSMDRLDETNPEDPVLQSADGNWVALKNKLFPHHRLLAKSKSQAFQALEKESSVVSAYDEMGSDSEDDFDWNMTLNKLHQRPQSLSENSYSTDSPHHTEWAYGHDQCPRGMSPSSGLYTNTEAMCSDSETSSVSSSREVQGPAKRPWLQRKPPSNHSLEKAHLQGGLDVNFNPQATDTQDSDSSEAEATHHTADKRSRRWRRNKLASEELGEEQPPTQSHEKDSDSNQVFDDLSETDISSEDHHHKSRTNDTEDKLKSRLFELAAKMSEKETSSGEEQESEPRTESDHQKGSLSSEDNGQCIQEELKKEKREALDVCLKLQFLSTVLQQKYSAVSLCNISTEVLKVINATEELIAESTGPWDFPADPPEREKGPFPLGTDHVRLDEQLTSLEENVYLTAGTVYGLEGQLNELEDAARRISSTTGELELAELEDQVATAAAQVHHAEQQISDIESRIAALTLAGLNVAPCDRLTRKRNQKQMNQVQTIDTSRQQRRKLPAPPVKNEKMEAASLTSVKTFNRNFILQGSMTQRTKERKSTAKDLMEPTPGSAIMF